MYELNQGLISLPNKFICYVYIPYFNHLKGSNMVYNIPLSGDDLNKTAQERVLTGT